MVEQFGDDDMAALDPAHGAVCFYAKAVDDISDPGTGRIDEDAGLERFAGSSQLGAISRTSAGPRVWAETSLVRGGYRRRALRHQRH